MCSRESLDLGCQNINPCTLCPVIDDLAVSTLTTESLTSSTIISDSGDIDILLADDSNFDSLNVDGLTVNESLARTQEFMNNGSFSANISLAPVVLDQIPFDSPSIGIFPGFDNGLMILTGQTGYLVLTIGSLGSSRTIGIEKSSLPPLFNVIPAGADAFSIVLPILSSDTFVSLQYGSLAIVDVYIFAGSL